MQRQIHTDLAHRLVHAGEAPWQIVAGGSAIVPPGGSVSLRKGVILSLGNGKRLLRVIE